MREILRQYQVRYRMPSLEMKKPSVSSTPSASGPLPICFSAHCVCLCTSTIKRRFIIHLQVGVLSHRKYSIPTFIRHSASGSAQALAAFSIPPTYFPPSPYNTILTWIHGRNQRGGPKSYKCSILPPVQNTGPNCSVQSTQKRAWVEDVPSSEGKNDHCTIQPICLELESSFWAVNAQYSLRRRSWWSIHYDFRTV